MTFQLAMGLSMFLAVYFSRVGNGTRPFLDNPLEPMELYGRMPTVEHSKPPGEVRARWASPEKEQVRPAQAVRRPESGHGDGRIPLQAEAMCPRVLP